MTDYDLPLNEDMSENFPAMDFEFPYLCIEGEIDLYIGGYVLWHWHEEPEFCLVSKGEIEYHLPDQVYVLKAGDAMYVNSKVPHMLKPHNGYCGAVIIPQIFHKLLLIGYHKSVFDLKYYRPIINCSALPCYYMDGSDDSPDDTAKAIIRLLHHCYLCAKEKKSGYELLIRNYISEIWLLLFHSAEKRFHPLENAPAENPRLNQMLKYINEHYAQKITLKEIADSVSVSERECIRCFKRHMQMTPFEYLLEYRIYTAANMLLHTDCSITDIALQNGFGTSSYFSKTFKEFMHCSPKSYRDTKRQNLKKLKD